MTYKYKLVELDDVSIAWVSRQVVSMLQSALYGTHAHLDYVDKGDWKSLDQAQITDLISDVAGYVEHPLDTNRPQDGIEEMLHRYIALVLNELRI